MRYLISGLLLTGLLFLVSPMTPAQDFDAVISNQNRKPFTVVDQIQDPLERQVFLSLFSPMNPRDKADVAEAFLAAYPQSWLLAQVYEIAAKAYIDLEKYDLALQMGRNSLALLPENPLLSVPLANVQASQSLYAEANRNAAEAFRDLDRFGRPSSIPEQEWPELERQLRASCLFALGRAAASEALTGVENSRRTQLLNRSTDFLSQARTFNPGDPEIPYLMGLSYLFLEKIEAAAMGFLVAYKIEGVLQARALQQLQRIYQASNREKSESFNTFVERLEQKNGLPKPEGSLQPTSIPSAGAAASLPLTNAARMPKRDYAGSMACRKCHADQYAAWEKTGMSRMFRPYQPENVIGDFQNAEFDAGDDVKLTGLRLEVTPGKEPFLFARMQLEGARHFIELRHSDGRWVRYKVDYTIGSKWQQAYATKLPNGQIHVFPLQYNRLHRRWVNFWKIIDLEGSERADVRSFEKFAEATSYQANCAVCHTSQLQNKRGRQFEADNLEFRESGINCEMCHGPSAQHVAAMTAGKPYAKQPLEPPVDFQKISPQDYVAICAQCHMQSAMRDAGSHGELNYLSESTEFFQRSKSRPLAEFSRKAFYKDGRFRETTFIVESLQRSGCFKKGQVTCGHCHSPHSPDAASNPKSLKFLQQPDQMCLQCHTKFSAGIELHTRHPAPSEASRCVSCHMPPIMNSLLFQARTHQIDDVPNSEMALRFGPKESPNACLMCHAAKDALWVKQQLQTRVKTEARTTLD
jgi:predicted CXXCH cytochrome family protein